MTFLVGLTNDLLTPGGSPSFGTAPLELLSPPGLDLKWEFIPESVTEITPEIMARYDGLYVNTPRVTAASVAGKDLRVKIVARHGVGYDSVDVKALNDKGVMLTNTPVAIQRPVSVAALTFILAIAGRLIEKDRLTRQNRWNERTNFMGLGLTTRTVGVIGIGGIGRELLKLARPFGWRMLAADPFVDASVISELGAEKVPLEDLMSQSDFVVITVLLNEKTRHLINADLLKRMKRSAYLINMARGPVVDEAALISALRDGTIAGAGLDVFEQEPVAPDNPLLGMDNVLLAPHSLCWTDECFDHMAREGLGCIVDFAQGKRPRSVVALAA
jgi:phosphoglycerate dehydrogenase-like enzyme